MGEQEKMDYIALIESTIETKLESKMKSQMQPIYWAVGIMLTIFISISVPLTLVLIEVARIQPLKAYTSELKASEEKADKTYLQKWDYYQIEEDEHRVIKEILKTPAQADYLMGIINENIVTQLGFKYQVRGEQKK